MKNILMSNGSSFSFDYGLKELVEHLQKEYKTAKEHLIILGEEGERITENNENNFDVFYCFHEKDFALNKPEPEHPPIPRLTKLKISESITLGVGSSILDTMSILKTVLEKSYKYDYQLADDLCDQAAKIYIQLHNATEEAKNKMICFQVAILNVSQFSNLDRLFSSISSLNTSLLQSLSDLPLRLSDMKQEVEKELQVKDKRTLYEVAFGEEDRIKEFVEGGRASAKKIEQLITEKRNDFEEIREISGNFMNAIEDLFKPEYEKLVQLFNSINQYFIKIKEIQSSAEENYNEYKTKIPKYTLNELVELQNRYTPREAELVNLISSINDLLSSFDSQRHSISLSLSSQYSHLSLLHSKASLIFSQTPLYQAISDKQIKYLIQLKSICLIPHSYRESIKEIQRRIRFKEGLKKELEKVNERVQEILKEEGQLRDQFVSDHRDSLLFSIFPCFLDPLPSSFSFDLSRFDPLLPPLPLPDYLPHIDISLSDGGKYKKQFSQLKSQFDAEKEQWAQELKQKDIEIDELRSQLQSIAKEKAKIEKDLGAEKASLSDSIHNISNEKLSLERRLSDLEVLQSQHSLLSSDVSKLNSTIASLTSEKSSLLNELDKTKNELANVNHLLSTSQNDLANVKKDLSHANAELSSVKENLSRVSSDFANSQNQLATTSSELSSVRDELANVKIELSNVKTQLLTSNRALSNTNDELANANKDFANSKKEIISLNNELVTAKNELVSSKNSLSMAVSELENSRKRSETLKSEIGELQSKIRLLNESLKEREQESSLSASMMQDQLSLSKVKWEGEIKELATSSENLRKENILLLDELDSKEKQLHSLDNVSQKLKEEIELLKKELSSKVTSLKDRIDKYKQKYDDIEKENLHLQVKLMNYEDSISPVDPLDHPVVKERLQKLDSFLDAEKKLSLIVEKFDNIVQPPPKSNDTFELAGEILRWFEDRHLEYEEREVEIEQETSKLQERLELFDFPLTLKSSFGAPSSIFKVMHHVMDWLDDYYLTTKLKKTIALTNFVAGDNVILFERKDKHFEIFSINCPNYILSEDCEGIFENNGLLKNQMANQPRELMIATILSIEEKITTVADDPYKIGLNVKYFIFYAGKFNPKDDENSIE